MRKHYTAQEKVAETASGDEPSEALRRTGAAPGWQKEFFENACLPDQQPPQSPPEQERIERLEKKIQTKDEVLAELMAEHMALKKSLGEL